MNDNRHQRRDDQRPGVQLDWEDGTPAAGTPAARDTVPAAPIRTWRERIGPPAAKLVRLGGLMANVMYNLAQRPGSTLAARDCEVMGKLRRDWDEARSSAPVDNQ